MSGRNTSWGTRDMVLTLAVLLVPIVLIVWFFQRVPDAPTVETADWQPVVARAKAEASFPVVAPSSVPSSWKVTQATWTKAGTSTSGGDPAAQDELRLGMVDDQQVFLQVREAKPAAADAWVNQNTRQAYDNGARKIGADVWRVLTSSDGRTNYLVLEQSGRVVLVSGDTTPERVQTLAELLTAA